MFGRKRAPRPAGDAGLQDRAWSMVERGEVLVRRNHALAALPDRDAYADVLLVQVPLRAADGGGDAAPTPGDFYTRDGAAGERQGRRGDGRPGRGVRRPRRLGRPRLGRLPALHGAALTGSGA